MNRVNRIVHSIRRSVGNAYRRRWVRLVSIVLAILVIAGFVVDRALDEPFRRIVERRMNDKLEGYTARVGNFDFHLFNFAIDLENLQVSQDAHPDPAVLVIPRLTMSINWRALLIGRLVADSFVDSPSAYINLVQLREENDDDVPLDERGWQDAFQSIYPLKINELRLHNGSLIYQDDSEFRPLHATRIELSARNIRNIVSKDREYPSTVSIEGAVFDVGRFIVDGHADFLAKPHLGIRASVGLDRVELDYFDPVVRRYNLDVQEGFLNGNGMFEYAPGVQVVDLESVAVSDAVIDYVYGGEPTEEVKRVAREISETARDAMNDPEVLFRIQRLVMENGTVGFVNRFTDPNYRVYVSNADFDLANLSSRAEDGVAQSTLTGTFMGTGQVKGEATFYPEGDSANFGAKLEVAETQMQPMNGLLRAHGNFDVNAGVFSVYTDVRVENGHIEGYVKPLFRDLDVYDPRQDKKDKFFHKVYERFVGGVAKILTNRRRDEVATIAKISGPVENPRSSTLQVIGHLIRNAFFKAILPGFEGEAERTPKRGAKRRSSQRKS